MRARRKNEAFDLWLACWTHEEIAERPELGVDKKTVGNWVGEICGKDDNWHKFHIFPDHSLDPDWTPPLYDVWKQQGMAF